MKEYLNLSYIKNDKLSLNIKEFKSVNFNTKLHYYVINTLHVGVLKIPHTELLLETTTKSTRPESPSSFRLLLISKDVHIIAFTSFLLRIDALQ